MADDRLMTVPEVADIVATLRVLHDPSASSSLARLLTGPRGRIGPRDLVALGRRVRAVRAIHAFATCGYAGADPIHHCAATPLARAANRLPAAPINVPASGYPPRASIVSEGQCGGSTPAFTQSCYRPTTWPRSASDLAFSLGSGWPSAGPRAARTGSGPDQ